MSKFLDEITKFFTNTLEDSKLIDSIKIPKKIEISNDVFSIENSVKKTMDFSS